MYLDATLLMVRRLHTRFSAFHQPDLIFWGCFFALNLLLFLPLMGALLGGFMRQIAARIAGM